MFLFSVLFSDPFICLVEMQTELCHFVPLQSFKASQGHQDPARGCIFMASCNNCSSTVKWRMSLLYNPASCLKKDILIKAEEEPLVNDVCDFYSCWSNHSHLQTCTGNMINAVLTSWDTRFFTDGQHHQQSNNVFISLWQGSQNSLSVALGVTGVLCSSLPRESFCFISISIS